MPVKVLTIPYHRQALPTYCGPACLQMLLDGVLGQTPQQDELYDFAHAHGHLDPQTNWFSPPDGIDWVLDSLTGANHFNVLALSSEASLSRRIVWSLMHSSRPAIALVYGWTHWVTVVGCDVDQAPTGPRDTGYTIRAFDIQDPWRTTDEGNPPPPPPPRHLTFKEWRRTYLKPIPDGHWKARVLAVGAFGADDREAPEPGYVVVDPGPSPVLVTPDTARSRALEGLDIWGLKLRPDWQPVLVPGLVSREPLLVQRLDEAGFYYLVPLGTAEAASPARVLVRVDAVDGDYLEANALGDGRPNGRTWDAMAADMQTEEMTRRFIVGRRFELSPKRGRVMARAEGVGVHPSFVWRPCIESLSPSMPFRVITIADRLYYLRLDGSLFDALHDAGPGM